MADFLSMAAGSRSRRNRTLMAATLLGLALWFLGASDVAHAGSRFGPPWEGRVTVDKTVVYSQPDRGSQPVGPLGRDSIVVVWDERTGADGSDWLAIPDGFVPASNVAEMFYPWLAEVTAPTVSIYARPFVASGIRRTARQNDLLRVTGVSGGLEGDTSLWWSTTEGYVPLGTLRWAVGDWAHWWGLPDGQEAVKGWWGTVVSQGNVRAAPSTESPIVGYFAGGERVKVLAQEEGENIFDSSKWYRIDGGRYAGASVHSSLIRRIADPQPNTTPPPADYQANSWIVVDRSAATLTFVKEGNPLFTTYISVGKAGVATPTGTYSTFGKFVGDRMSSRTVANAEHSYDLPNVPFTQYYLDGGYAIHGTYWHDGFGTPESQGCINLTWADSAYLFSLTRPAVPSGANYRWAAADGGVATPVVILN